MDVDMDMDVDVDMDVGVSSSMDMDQAWESNSYDQVLLLLEKDKEFPKNFDVRFLGENNEHERRLIEFTEKRNKVHLFIKEDNLGELKSLISNDKSKLYLNDKNQSAVFTAIVNKKFQIYAFLKSKNADFKDVNEKRKFNTLNTSEKSTIESELVRYFPRRPKAHISYLVSKSKPSSDTSEDFEEKVQRYYETLSRITEINTIFQVIQYADYLDIIFDFDNDNVSDLCPNDSKNTKGKTAYKDGRIYIAAGNNRSEEEILGTIAHEVTHIAMQLIYENNCDPYYKNDLVKKSKFEDVTKIFSRNTNLREKCRQRDTSSAILFSTFSVYNESDYHSELIVRVPQILAQYKELGREWLMKEAYNLFDYFNEVMTDCQTSIDQSYILKPRKQIRWMNESVGEIKKIRGFPLCFNDISEIKTFLEGESKKICLVAGKSPRLCVLKILQALYDKDYINSCDQYLVLKFQNFVNEAEEILQNFYAEGSDTLIIEYSAEDHSSAKLQQQALNFLGDLQQKKQNKKIIFAVNQKEEQELKKSLKLRKLDFGYFFDSCQSLRDLDDHSQKQVIKKKIRHQNKEFELEHFVKDDTIKSLIDAKIIGELISDQKIEIENKVDGIASLDGAYANLQEEINTEILMSELLHSRNTIFVFEGCKNKEELKLTIQKFSSFNIENLDEETHRLKMVKKACSDEKFKTLCQQNPKKDIYLLKINNEKKRSCLLLRKLYMPNFYVERNFLMYEKIIIDCGRLEELSKCKGVNILISNTNKENFSRFLQKRLNEQENDGTSKILVSITRKRSQFIIETKPITNFYKKETENSKAEKKIDLSRISFAETDDEAQKIFDESIKCGNTLFWLKKEEDHVIYNDSIGSLNYIRNIIDVKQTKHCKVSEIGLMKKMKHTKAIIIADDPGMGKSTTLIKLIESQSILDDHWIIKINLKKFLERMNIQDKNIHVTMMRSNLVNCLLSELNAKSGKELTKTFLKSAIYPKYHFPISLLLLFDGFDEVLDEEYRNKIISIFKIMKKETKVKFLITTRLHCKNDLENSLSIFAFEFEPIENTGRINFIKTYIKTRLKLTLRKEVFESDSFSLYVTKFLEKMRSIFKVELDRFIGTPLQQHLMLEDAVGNFRNWISQQHKNNQDPDFSYFGNNMSQVYLNFIDRKYHYFKNMKKEGNEYPLDDIKSICDTCHLKLAETLTLDSKPNVSLENFECARIALACGIVKCQDGNLKFIHSTFREYYAARKFIKWFEKDERFSTNQKNEFNYIFENVLLQPHYRIIRSFLNDMFAEINIGTKESRNLEYLKTNLNTSYRMRKPSHVIIPYTLIQEELANIFKFLLSLIERENLLKIRCRFNDPLLTYACRCNRKSIVECFLDKCDEKLNSDQFFRLLCMKGQSKETCLHHAAFYNNVEIIKLILDKAAKKCSLEEIYQFLEMKDAHENTWLHLSASCLGQFFSVINEEINRGHFLRLDLLPFIIMYQNQYKYLFPEMPYELLFQILKGILLTPDLHNAISAVLLLSIQSIKDKYPTVNTNPSAVFELILEKIPEKKVRCMIRAKNSSGCNCLHFAIENGDADLVQLILERDERSTFNRSPNLSLCELITETTDSINMSMIHISILKEEEQITRLILDKIPRDKIYEIFCLTNDCGDNILHISAQLGLSDLIYYILETLKKVTSQKDFESFLFSSSAYGGNPLHLATAQGHLSVVRLLLEHAAGISTECQYQYIISTAKEIGNAIHFACCKNNIDITRFLLEMVPAEKMYETSCLTNHLGANILHMAAYLGNYALLELILDKVRAASSEKCFENFLLSKTANQFGATALHIAAGVGHSDVVQILLQSAADISPEFQYKYLTFVSKEKYNCLHVATFQDHHGVVQLLLEAIPTEKLYETLTLSNNTTHNILHMCTFNGNISITKSILQKLISLPLENIRSVLFLKDSEDRNALHCAVIKNHISTVELLLHYATGKLLDYEYLLSSHNKMNSIYLAVRLHYSDMVKLLMDKIPAEKLYETLCVNTHNRGGIILHDLAEEGNEKSMELVLQKIEEKVTSKNLDTFLFAKAVGDINPVHAAAFKGHLSIVKILMRYTAKITDCQYKHLTLMDNQMHNALHTAVIKDRQPIVRFFLNKIPSHNMHHVLSLSDDKGFNVLHMSAIKGNSDLVKFILKKLKVLSTEQITDFLQLKTNEGLSSLELAKKQGHTLTANILRGFYIRTVNVRYSFYSSLKN